MKYAAVAPEALSRWTVCAGGARGQWMELAKLAATCGLMSGGAWGTSWIAGRLGLPVSRGLVFEGRWLAPSWDAFPWLDCVGMMAFMAAAPPLLETLRGCSLRSVGFQFSRKTLLLTVVGLMGAALIYGGRRAGFSVERALEGPSKLSVLGPYWFVVAVAEETAFRSILQRRLTNIYGLKASLAVTAVMFVLWHGTPAPDLVCASRLAAAIGLGLLYQWSGSLVPPILCHWALDLAVAC